MIIDASDDGLNSDWLDSVLKFTKSASSNSNSSKDSKDKDIIKDSATKPKPPANKPAIPAKPATASKPPPPSTDYMLEHIHQRFSELAASTLAAANAAVTSETEARAMVKCDSKGTCIYQTT